MKVKWVFFGKNSIIRKVWTTNPNYIQHSIGSLGFTLKIKMQRESSLRLTIFLHQANTVCNVKAVYNFTKDFVPTQSLRNKNYLKICEKNTNFARFFCNSIPQRFFFFFRKYRSPMNSTSCSLSIFICT